MHVTLVTNYTVKKYTSSLMIIVTQSIAENPRDLFYYFYACL